MTAAGWRLPGWPEWLVAGIAAALACALGYVYSVAHPATSADGARVNAQRLLTPAVNYACTGRFGPLRLTADATSADTVGLSGLVAFLELRQPRYSCGAFPPHAVATSVFDGIEPANVEHPFYLVLLYGILWRWFGVQWALLDYLVAASVALSFAVVYVCARGFMPPFVAAAVALGFVANPLYLAFSTNPRDALKFPFAVAIAAVLIAGGTAARRPLRYLRYAGGVGLLIGVGYGFRSDIYLFILPAAVVLAGLGQVDLGSPRAKGPTRWLAQGGVRIATVTVLGLGFGIGGSMPLLNDHFRHPHAGDIGYHALAMGLLGHSRHDLYQRDGIVEGLYMYRNGYNNDLAVGVRVMEYAARRYGEVVPWAQERYWASSKRFYLSVASVIPADLVSGAMGAFVNLMTMPKSLRERLSLLAPVDASAPWTTVYDFARHTWVDVFIVRPLDAVYRTVTRLPVSLILVTNLVVFVAFLCMTARRFGHRAAAATLVVLGAVLAVTSLKVELRHMFHLYVFLAVAWGTVAWIIVRPIAVPGNEPAPADAAPGDRPGWPVGKIALLLVVSTVAVVALLETARMYQVHVLRPLLADWAQRPRTATETRASEVSPGMTRIRPVSAMPLSSGGQRPPGSALTERVAMGVVAVDVDSRRCAGRRVDVTMRGESNVNDNSFWLFERRYTPAEPMEYVVYLPAFYYRLQHVEMAFAGVDVETRNLPCIRGVSFVTEFKPDDVLFDFVIPKDVSRVRRRDLYQQLYLPGLGYF